MTYLYTFFYTCMCLFMFLPIILVELELEQSLLTDSYLSIKKNFFSTLFKVSSKYVSMYTKYYTQT